MPVKSEVANDGLVTTQDDLRGDMHSICTTHAKAVRTLVVNRLDRGPASGPLKTRLKVERDAAESEAELVEAMVDAVMKLVMRDAMRPRGRGASPENVGTVGAWSGELVLLDKAGKKLGSPLKIDIEDPSEGPSRESELVSILKEVRLLYAGERAGLVAIYGALGKREKQQAKLFGAVAKSQSRLSKSAGKYKYRTEKERQQTEREDIAARERSAKRKFFWEAVESIGVEWKDVGEIWSKYYTVGRKPGDPKKKPPQKPTLDELTSVFSRDEVFEKHFSTTDEGVTSMRTLAAQMIAEPDFERRRTLSRAMAEIGKQIPDIRAKLETAMLAALTPQRALEIAAWFKLPVTW